MKLRYSQCVDSTTILGPGNRAVIWVYGCCFDCPGCIAKNYRHGKSITSDTSKLVQWYLQTGSEGLTISGGEPFLQASALSELIKAIRLKTELDVIVYSGFYYDELIQKNDSEVNQLLSEIDLLIDGPYIEAENNNEPYRGSGNQHLILLTDRLKTKVNDYYEKEIGRKIQIYGTRDETVMIGVPSREQVELWNILRKYGNGE